MDVKPVVVVSKTQRQNNGKFLVITEEAYAAYCDYWNGDIPTHPTFGHFVFVKKVRLEESSEIRAVASGSLEYMNELLKGVYVVEVDDYFTIPWSDTGPWDEDWFGRWSEYLTSPEQFVAAFLGTDN